MTFLATPLAGRADAPAKDQYVPPPLSATGSGHGPGSGDGTLGSAQSDAAKSSGSNSPVVPILVGGLAVLAAAALIAYRRRRSTSREPA